jgi:hypothetical protein
MKPRVCPRNRAEWCTWLQDHRTSAGAAWLVFYKKHTGKPSVACRDSVEEAIQLLEHNNKLGMK